MSRRREFYFKYRCSICNAVLYPVKAKTPWTNYYCPKCGKVVFTDYNFTDNKGKQTMR